MGIWFYEASFPSSSNHGECPLTASQREEYPLPAPQANSLTPAPYTAQVKAGQPEASVHQVDHSNVTILALLNFAIANFR